MKVGVVNTWLPFARGGAEILAEALTEKLQEFGHEAHLIRLPFRWVPAEKVSEHIVACRLLNLEEFDHIVALKFPSYYVKHERKTLWLLHQFRQVYDLWFDSTASPPSTTDEETRRIVTAADNRYLTEFRKIYTNSHVTQERLKHYNDLDATVLYPPVRDEKLFSSGPYGDYIFCPSRINRAKRQYLLIEALAQCRTPVRLVLTGLPDSSDDEKRLRVAIQRYKVEDRVELLPRFISEQEKAQYFADALGAAYIPVDEDSYGYVVLEAYLSRRPVITCSDSGGTLILVKDGVSGPVTDPNPEELARAFDALYENKTKAREMGEAGLELVRRLDISWQNVIQRLLDPA